MNAHQKIRVGSRTNPHKFRNTPISIGTMIPVYIHCTTITITQPMNDAAAMMAAMTVLAKIFPASSAMVGTLLARTMAAAL